MAPASSQQTSSSRRRPVYTPATRARVRVCDKTVAIKQRVEEVKGKAREQLGHVRRRVKNGVHRVRETTTKRLRRAVTGDKTGQTRVRDHIRTAPVVKLRDRVAFTWGVVNLAVTQ